MDKEIKKQLNFIIVISVAAIVISLFSMAISFGLF